MIRKCLVLVAISMLVGSYVFAEPLRTFFVKENRMPGKFKTEVGAIGNYTEYPDDYAPMGNGGDSYSVGPYARFGLAETVAVSAEIPYVQRKPTNGDEEQGIGDVDIGAEAVIYEDIFGYPFIVPHADVSLDTGDEDKGLGNGKTLFTAGVSVGTVVMDMFHYIVDASYTFNQKSDNAAEGERNVASFGGAFIWDLNDQFSLIAEGKGVIDKNDEGAYPMYFQGGCSYQPTEKVFISLLGGSSKNTDEGTIVNAKVTYCF